MAQFLIGYYGGSAPESPDDRQKQMKAWFDWVDAIGAAFINPGNPVGKTVTITREGVSDKASPHPIMGFAILEADDMERACAMLKDCPHFMTGGYMEVSPIIDLPPRPETA